MQHVRGAAVRAGRPPGRRSGRAPRSATRTPCTRTRRSAWAECNVAGAWSEWTAPTLEGADRAARAARGPSTRTGSGSARATRAPGAGSASCSRRRATEWTRIRGSRRSTAPQQGREIPLVDGPLRRRSRRLDPLPGAAPRAPAARDRLDVAHPSAWGTGANVEAKLLQLEHAFEVLGCRRVEFKTDALNERARGASQALPARVRGHPPQAHARPRAARTATPPGTA